MAHSYQGMFSQVCIDYIIKKCLAPKQPVVNLPPQHVTALLSGLANKASNTDMSPQTMVPAKSRTADTPPATRKPRLVCSHCHSNLQYVNMCLMCGNKTFLIGKLYC
jgi:hypothetical protein